MLVRNLVSNPIKRFSNQLKYFSRQKLLESIMKEIDNLQMEYKPIPKEKQRVFSKNLGFEMSESKRNAKMELRKTHKDMQIKLIYYSSYLGIEESNQNIKTNNKVYVSINKVGKSNGIFIEAVNKKGALHINKVHFADNIKEFISKFNNKSIDPDQYKGIEFSTLDDKLQAAYTNLLKDFEINSECIEFIEKSSYKKEDELYLGWLKSSRNVLL